MSDADDILDSGFDDSSDFSDTGSSDDSTPGGGPDRGSSGRGSRGDVGGGDSGQDRSDVRGGGGGGGVDPGDDSDDFGGGSSGGGGRSGGTGRDPTRTIRETADVSAGIGSPGGIDNPEISGTTPRDSQRTSSETVQRDPLSISGDGPIASTGIPGTDATIGGALDAGSRTFEREITDPLASAAERDISGDQAAITPVQQIRGQRAADFTRGAVGALNIPAAGAAGVRVADEITRQTEPAGVGGPILIGTEDPQRTEQTAAASREAGSAAVEFTEENPGRAAAFGAGAVAGGVGAGAAIRGGRIGARGIARSADDAVSTPDPVGQPRQPGTGGTGSVLDPSDIQQPASRSSSASSGSRVRSQIDEFLADERGQLGAGRQRQRPDSGSRSRPDPGDDLLEGSPRDRISSDITRRTREDLDQARGGIDAGDPIAPRGSGRGTAPGNRVPRDPLDTRGGRSPTGGSADPVALGTGTGATLTATTDPLLDGSDATSIDTEAATSADDVDAIGDVEVDTDIGVGPGEDVDQTPDEDNNSQLNTGTQTAQDTPLLTTLRGETVIGPEPLADSSATPTGRGGGRDPFRRPGRSTSTGGPPRPRTPPRIDPDLDREDGEEPLPGLGLGEAQFENPTQSLTEVDEELIDDLGGGG